MMNEKCIINDIGPFQRDHRGNATRHVPGGGITSAIRDAQSVASARERPASAACSERLPPGRAAATHRLHRLRTPAPPHAARRAARPRPPATAAASRTARLLMFFVRNSCGARDPRGWHAPRDAGSRSCALRHASVSADSYVLPQLAICRDAF